jgi:hypothetical protein
VVKEPLLHALPDRWEGVAYGEFLNRRRELMAKVIAELMRGPARSPVRPPAASTNPSRYPFARWERRVVHDDLSGG